MLIRTAVLEGIAEGRVTCAFRWWRRPSVRAGTVMRTARGLVRVEAVQAIDPAEVTDGDARRAGLASRTEVLEPPPRHADARLYRIELSYAGEDPRVALRQRDHLDDGEVAELGRRLERFDRVSRHGPWTAMTLRLVAERPHTLAAELAAELGLDKPVFKRDVRKLKELGLTESLDVGYRLSPRGRAYVARTAADVTPAPEPEAPAGSDGDLAGVREHCLAKPGANEGHPFGPGALVMKVAGKIFAIIGEDAEPASISLKCDPDEVPLLRRSYPAVRPGYHLDKRHWNTVTLDGTVPPAVLHGWVDDSYDLVVEKLSRRVRDQLAGG